MAIASFADRGTADVYNGLDSKAARRVCPMQLWRAARRKLDQVNAATRLANFRIPPANQFEALKRERAGQHSIRINDQYRVCFRWTEAGCEQVEIVNYH